MSDVAEIVIRATDQASATIDKSAAAVGRMQTALAKADQQATKSSTAVLKTGTDFGKLGSSLNVLVNGPLALVAPEFGKVGEQVLVAGSSLAAMPGIAKSVGVAFTALVANPVVLVATALAGLVVGAKAWLDSGEKIVASNQIIGDSYRKDVAAALSDTSAQFQQQFDNIGRLQDMSKAASDAAKSIAAPFKDLVAQNTLAKAGVGFEAFAVAGSEAFNLLGDDLGKLLGADGKINTELGKNIDGVVNTAAERLGRLDEQVGPGTVESIGKLTQQIAGALGLTASEIATASTKPGGIRDALLIGYQQADPTTRLTVDNLSKFVVQTTNDTATALLPIGFALANNLTDPLIAKVNLLQQALTNLLATVGGSAGSGTVDSLGGSTTVTGSVGSGGGSVGGGPIPGGVGGGAIPGGPGGAGQSNATYGGAGGGAFGGGSFVNHGSVNLTFPSVTNGNEALHVLDVLSGGQ